MASFGGASQGGVDDGVRVQFFSKTEKFQKPRFFEDYSVRVSVLQQPAAFAVRLSARDGSAELLKAIPNNTKFQLYVGLLPQFTGYTDGQAGNGSNQSTSVTLKGRDTLGKLFSNDVGAEKSFTNITYQRLVEAAMLASGFVKGTQLSLDNKQNRQISTGYRVRTTREPVIPPGVIRTDGGSVVKHVVHAKLGESWLDFVRRHIAKRGLFVWADHAGGIVLSTPNAHQSATFKIVRQRNKARGVVNVREGVFHNDTTRRFSEVVIWSRSGGRHNSRGKLQGGFVDDEMTLKPPAGFGIPRVKTYRDVNVTSTKEAESYARRRIAEINRASCFVSYTFAGHTAPTPTGERAIIRPDLVAHVTDDEFGLNELMYVESVEYKSPPQTTTVTLMRLRDIVFEPEPDERRLIDLSGAFQQGNQGGLAQRTK